MIDECAKSSDLTKAKSNILVNVYKIDNNDQYQKRENIRIGNFMPSGDLVDEVVNLLNHMVGLKEKTAGLQPGENNEAVQSSQSLFNSQADLSLNKSLDTGSPSVDGPFSRVDISDCHFTNPKSGKKKQVIVRFVSRMSVRTVYRHKRKLRDSPIPAYKSVFITDDITPLRLRMKNVVSQIPGVEKTFFRDGNVHCIFKKKHFKLSSPDDIFKELGVEMTEVVYIPPEGSPYSSLEIFDSIESNIVDLLTQYNNASFTIFGDFNAHCGKLLDYVEFDPYVADNNLDDIATRQMSIKNLLDLGIPLERFSLDQSNINNYGYRLLDMCKSTGLCIANGRCGNDMYLGKCTCKNTSLVDYLLLSHCNLPNVNNFVVNDFDPILSDAHSSISFKFCCHNLSDITDSQENDNDFDVNFIEDEVKKPIWDNTVKERFLSSFDEDTLLNLQSEVDSIFNNKKYSEDSINSLTNKISELFVNAVDNSNLIFAKKTSMYKPHTSKKKPWFDADCDTARKIYLHDKNYYRRIKTVDSYNIMVNSTFWNLLNKYSGDRKDTVSKISSQVFYEHFIKLNQSVVDGNDVASQDFDDTSVEYSNEFLNAVISIEELKK
ncbi:hypothetical protein MAR_028479, partial [Mya arenaria]